MQAVHLYPTPQEKQLESLDINSLWNNFLEESSSFIWDDNYDNFFWFTSILKKQHYILGKEELLNIFSLICQAREMFYNKCFENRKILYKANNCPIPEFLELEYFTEIAFLNFIGDIKQILCKKTEITLLVKEIDQNIPPPSFNQRLYSIIYKIALSFLTHNITLWNNSPFNIEAKVIEMFNEFFYLHKRVIGKAAIALFKNQVFPEIWKKLISKEIKIPNISQSNFINTLNKWYFNIESGRIEEIYEGEIILLLSKRSLKGGKIHFKAGAIKERGIILYKKIDHIIKNANELDRYTKKAENKIIKGRYLYNSYLLTGMVIYNPNISNNYQFVYYPNKHQIS